MKRFNIFYFLLMYSLAVFLNSSCKEEAHEKDMNIEGIWMIKSAERNGRATSTLDKGFFEFDSVGDMRTNILGDTLVSGYTKVENLIMQSGLIPIEYQIRYKDEDSMHLSAEIRNFHFDFYTNKRNEADTILQ